MNRLILASASPRRRELLEQIGMEFDIITSDAEERGALKAGEKLPACTPPEMVQRLSALKALDVFEKLPGDRQRQAVVVGADTVVSCDERIMGKPRDAFQAREMLSCLQGRTHQVYTGVTLVFWEEKNGSVQKLSFCERTDVTMYPMSEGEIRAYVDTGEPADKAGAYAIQGKCAAHIEKISGDYNNVVGLPVGRLCQEIKKCGLSGLLSGSREADSV